VSDELDLTRPEADEAAQRDDADDVEAHTVKPADAAAATEEGPDVEGHTIKPNIKP
jgi:hypothetical protein